MHQRCPVQWVPRKLEIAGLKWGQLHEYHSSASYSRPCTCQSHSLAVQPGPHAPCTDVKLYRRKQEPAAARVARVDHSTLHVVLGCCPILPSVVSELATMLKQCRHLQAALWIHKTGSAHTRLNFSCFESMLLLGSRTLALATAWPISKW